MAPDPDIGVQPDEVLAELNALLDRQQQVNPTVQQVDYFLATGADPQRLLAEIATSMPFR